MDKDITFNITGIHILCLSNGFQHVLKTKKAKRTRFTLLKSEHAPLDHILHNKKAKELFLGASQL